MAARKIDRQADDIPPLLLAVCVSTQHLNKMYLSTFHSILRYAVDSMLKRNKKIDPGTDKEHMSTPT